MQSVRDNYYLVQSLHSNHQLLDKAPQDHGKKIYIDPSTIVPQAPDNRIPAPKRDQSERIPAPKRDQFERIPAPKRDQFELPVCSSEEKHEKVHEEVLPTRVVVDNVEKLECNLGICEPTPRVFEKVDVGHKGREQKAIHEAQIVQSHARKSKEIGGVELDRLFIFLHGYNNTELEMNKRAAQIDSKLGTTKVMTTAFPWPSYCSLFGYDMDQKEVRKCSQLFVMYLKEIRKAKIYKFKQINIVAHSMGNYLLTQTMKSCDPSLFDSSNIICVAADSPYDEYNECIGALHGVVSNWIHYWTNADWALWGSSTAFVNRKKRAGQMECKYKDKYENILSIEWTEHEGLAHSYIDDILGDEDEFAMKVIKRLTVKDDAPPDADDADSHNVMDYKKNSELWNKVYVDGDGDGWFSLGDGMYKDKDGFQFGVDRWGEFKVQQKSFFSEAYRIIYRRNKENKWKIMLCSPNWDEIENKYNDYVAMLQWKRAQ